MINLNVNRLPQTHVETVLSGAYFTAKMRERVDPIALPLETIVRKVEPLILGISVGKGIPMAAIK